jgi:hypothetical protein
MPFYEPVQGFEGLTERIAEYQAQKDARAAAAKAEQQATQLAACSFAPSVNQMRVFAKVGVEADQLLASLLCLACR